MRLKELRTQSGAYQKDIADRLGIDRTTYAKYESGASEPSQEMLIKLAKLFDVSLDYLLEISDTNEKKPTTESSELEDMDIKDILDMVKNTPVISEIVTTLSGMSEKDLRMVDQIIKQIKDNR